MNSDLLIGGFLAGFVCATACRYLIGIYGELGKYSRKEEMFQSLKRENRICEWDE